ncbi:MIP18 family protein yitW [Listeria monocytogenes serotype 4b str. LL195]|nr:MIP18 family protein yitW [Listeria monocytogenes serotype 4b str. LL195]
MCFMDEQLKENLMGALEQVIDPELGIDIVNIGLVYDVELDDDGLCTVSMTLTTMGCPLAGILTEQVQMALSDIPEVKDTNVNLVWNPPWTKDRMSRYAKIALGIR